MLVRLFFCIKVSAYPYRNLESQSSWSEWADKADSCSAASGICHSCN